VNVSLDESAETEEPSARMEVEDHRPESEQLLRPTGTATNSFRGHESVNARNGKAIKLRELDERSTEETARIMGISSVR